MNPVFRLSRIEAPRATFWSVLLLVVALGVFGTWAHACHPTPAAEVVDLGLPHQAIEKLIGVVVRW